MAVTVQIPQPMREATGGEANVSTAGETVALVLQNLITAHSALAPKLFDNGKLRHYVNIYVNDEDIRFLDDLETSVKDGDVVALIPAVAGG